VAAGRRVLGWRRKRLAGSETWAPSAGGKKPAGCRSLPLLDAVPPVRHCAGRPRKRLAKLHADKGYNYDQCRWAARRRGITPRIARRGIESSERLGRHRWVVERTLARFRRLDLLLAAALICLGFVARWCR